MHITLVDTIIVFLAIGALLRGFQIGFFRQFISTVAFVIGLFPGTWIAAYVMDRIAGPTKPLAGLAVLLTTCFLLMSIGEILAVRAKLAVRNDTVQKLDNGIGGIVSVITLTLGLWLAAAIFSLAPPSSLQTQLKNSAIIGSLNTRLPSPTTVLRSLNTLIDPNQSPQVFAGREPAPDAKNTLPDPEKYATVLRRAQSAVVKIEGLGCGGIVDGSGFAFASQYVATNAHVVAGVKSPKVQHDGITYNTTVVLFDAENDIAVLRLDNAQLPTLTINRMSPVAGSPVFALGYPGGGEYTVSPGVLLDTFDAFGQDIYGRNHVTREIYSLQTTIVRGNSGGPVVASDGTAIGVVFATSTTYNNIGYALTMNHIHEHLREAQTKSAAVNTGQCSE